MTRMLSNSTVDASPARVLLVNQHEERMKPAVKVLVQVGVWAACCTLNLAAAAPNDCAASVRFDGIKPSGAGVVLEFYVTTNCDGSAGRFAYTYETSNRPGKDVERNAPSWSGADGRSFKWTDTLLPGSNVVVSNVKVKTATIESTKVK